jgi:hypothetical protein
MCESAQGNALNDCGKGISSGHLAGEPAFPSRRWCWIEREIGASQGRFFEIHLTLSFHRAPGFKRRNCGARWDWVLVQVCYKIKSTVCHARNSMGPHTVRYTWRYGQRLDQKILLCGCSSSTDRSVDKDLLSWASREDTTIGSQDGSRSDFCRTKLQEPRWRTPERPLSAKAAADLTASVGTSDVVYPGILTQLTSFPSVPRANGLLPPQLMAVG